MQSITLPSLTGPSPTGPPLTRPLLTRHEECHRAVGPCGRWAAGFLAWLLLVTSVSAQAAFSPPPPALPPAPATAATAVGSPSQSTPPIATQVARSLARPQVPIKPTVSSGVQPLEGGQIVARIDGQIVLASDVLWQVNQLIEANRDRIPLDKTDEAKQALLRQQVMGLIDTKMLYANFRRKVPAEGIPQIEENLHKPFEEAEIPRLVEMLNLKNRSELDGLLRESGTSLADLQRQFNERTIAGEWLRQLVPKPKEATHEEMLAYYREHQQEYEFPAQAKWEEVMIRRDRVHGDRTQAWQAITGLGNDVWQRVAKQPGLRGPVFEEIAKEKSHGFNAKEGGQHGWTSKGALRSKEIDAALFTLQVGQLSSVIESDLGFHIVRVLDRKEAGRTPFTESQAQIRKALGKDQQKGLAQVELAKIRKKSRIWTIFDGDLSGPK